MISTYLGEAIFDGNTGSIDTGNAIELSGIKKQCHFKKLFFDQSKNALKLTNSSGNTIANNNFYNNHKYATGNVDVLLICNDSIKRCNIICQNIFEYTRSSGVFYAVKEDYAGGNLSQSVVSNNITMGNKYAEGEYGLSNNSLSSGNLVMI